MIFPGGLPSGGSSFLQGSRGRVHLNGPNGPVYLPLTSWMVNATAELDDLTWADDPQGHTFPVIVKKYIAKSVDVDVTLEGIYDTALVLFNDNLSSNLVPGSKVFVTADLDRNQPVHRFSFFLIIASLQFQNEVRGVAKFMVTGKQYGDDYGLLPTQTTPYAEGLSSLVMVVSVTDGDTIIVREGEVDTTISLEGIDAPEPDQPYGSVASAYLRNKLPAGAIVTLVPKVVDDRDRMVGRILLGTEDVNASMLAAGMAWHYYRYDNRISYSALERTARLAGTGLWGSPVPPIAPWDWRNANRDP